MLRRCMSEPTMSYISCFMSHLHRFCTFLPYCPSIENAFRWNFMPINLSFS